MADDWGNTVSSSKQYDDNTDEAPDDWEAELEKPEKVETSNKPANVKPVISTEESSNTADSVEKTLGKDNPEQNAQSQAGETIVSFSFDNVILTKRNEILDYSSRLTEHLQKLANNEFYSEFMDNFIQGVTKPLSTEQLKRLQAAIQTVLSRKVAEDFEKNKKPKAKKTFKPQLKDDSRGVAKPRAIDVDDYDDDDEVDDDDSL